MANVVEVIGVNGAIGVIVVLWLFFVAFGNNGFVDL